MELAEIKQQLDRLDKLFESQAAIFTAQRRDRERDRIKDSFRPLSRSLSWTIGLGMLATFVGVSVWHPLRHSLGGVFASGVILHALGIAMILFGAVIKMLIGQIDANGPVVLVQKRLAKVRQVHALAGVAVGLSWLILWVPATIAVFRFIFGVDIYASAQAMWGWMTAGGAVAMLAIGLVYRWALTSGRTGITQAFGRIFAGPHLALAQRELDAIFQFERD